MNKILLILLLLLLIGCKPQITPDYSEDSDINDFSLMEKEMIYVDSMYQLYDQDVKWTVKYIVIHCTGGTPRHTSMDELNRVFRDRGWDRPGYHGIIDYNKPGQEPKVYWTANLIPKYNTPSTVRYGAEGYNRQSIHLSFVGGRDKDNRTPEQIQKMEKILRNLKKDYFPNAKIVGHNDLNPKKACPRFNVRLSLPIDLR